MAVSKNNRAARANSAREDGVVGIHFVKKAGAYVKTYFERGVQKQEWYSDRACTTQITR